MSVSTVINSVTTEDAVPTTAPHKVSHQSGKTNATVVFTPTNTTGHAITCYRIEVGGSAPGTGSPLLAWDGFPCSDSLAESTCSDTDATRQCTDGIGLASGASKSVNVDGNALTSVDGDYTVNVYCGSDDTALG